VSQFNHEVRNKLFKNENKKFSQYKRFKENEIKLLVERKIKVNKLNKKNNLQEQKLIEMEQNRKTILKNKSKLEEERERRNFDQIKEMKRKILIQQAKKQIDESIREEKVQKNQ